MKVSWEEWHTVMGHVKYARCFAPKFDQESIDHLIAILSDNERTPWGPCRGMTIVIWWKHHLVLNQRCHPLLFQQNLGFISATPITEALHLISRPFFTYPKAMNVEDLAIKVRPQEMKKPRNLVRRILKFYFCLHIERSILVTPKWALTKAHFIPTMR